MKTKLTKIHYFKWDGDIIAAHNEFDKDNNLKVELSGTDLILRNFKDETQYIKIKRGLNIVKILVPQPPHNIGWAYFRMSDNQLKQYINKANKGGHIIV